MTDGKSQMAPGASGLSGSVRVDHVEVNTHILTRCDTMSVQRQIKIFLITFSIASAVPYKTNSPANFGVHH